MFDGVNDYDEQQHEHVTCHSNGFDHTWLFFKTIIFNFNIQLKFLSYRFTVSFLSCEAIAYFIIAVVDEVAVVVLVVTIPFSIVNNTFRF